MAFRAALVFGFLRLVAFVSAQSAPAPTPCASTIGQTSGNITTNFVFQDGLGPALDLGLNKTLPYEGKKSNPWEDHNSLPSACLAAATGRCDLNDMQLYDVLLFQSCATPWVFCRCANAEMGQADTRDSFGRIGSQLRSHVRHVMAFPQPLLGASSHQDIIFGGPVGNRTYVSGIIHQAAHAMDLGLGYFSHQDPWKNAVADDDCVADKTATFSYSEAFAQAMVVHISRILNNTITDDISCMNEQLSLLNATFPYSKLFEPNCELNVKPRASETVSKGITSINITQPASTHTQATPSSASPQGGDGYRQAGGVLRLVAIAISCSIIVGLI